MNLVDFWKGRLLEYSNIYRHVRIRVTCLMNKMVDENIIKF
jgi:hypothetical protein